MNWAEAFFLIVILLFPDTLSLDKLREKYTPLWLNLLCRGWCHFWAKTSPTPNGSGEGERTNPNQP